MDKEMYWDILDQKRLDILPPLKSFKDNFYLSGGTALALQLGHRDSIDFNFFTKSSFSTEELFKKTQQVFVDHRILKTQEVGGTLSFVIDDGIKFSFFTYPYNLVEPLLNEDNFMMASVKDIGAMKLSAITSRSVLKDYVDLYFILHQINLGDLLKLAREKFPMIDSNPILKSLIYFDDIQEEPILFKHNNDISFESVKKHLTGTVKNHLSEVNKQ